MVQFILSMDSSRGSQYIFLFLLSFIVSSSCTSAEKLEGKVFHPSRRELYESFHFEATQHDLVNPPFTTTTPVTNPVTTPSIVPPDNSAPSVVTVPATNPIGVTPNPVATPATIPTATPVPVPVTNPVNPAVPVTNPVTTPVTNPVTTPTPSGALPVTSPVTNPTPAPVTTNAPAIPGQSWCVAKSGTSETTIQLALDYACGMGGADCSAIQQGGMCYNPNTLQNHASVAFNNYYQKNPTQASCDFGGTAMIINANPSSGSCIFATLSSSSSPATASTSGATPTGSGTSPTVLNASNPTSGDTTSTGFGNSPPNSSTSTSISNRLRPAIGCIHLMITFTFTRITLF
ncbi:hypothetical protein ACH5RR_022774 [Cinchona calisaya]|uniref:X8 domain-containing protein n=1 Tax=Cinchona calisaya TaxID=153742 RepID=A0ABD2ZBY2_9GENT